MRTILALAGAAALTAFGTVASAETPASTSAAAAATVRAGQTVVTADGRRLGRIDRVDGARVGLIVDMKYVYVPVATLSASEKGRLATSLTYKQALGN